MVQVAPVGEMAQVQRSGREVLTSEAALAITGMPNPCNPVEARTMLIADAFLLR